MRRRRVDWDEEIRKTDRIRRRGFALSALSLVVALGVIFGVGRMGGVDVSVFIVFNMVGGTRRIAYYKRCFSLGEQAVPFAPAGRHG